MVELKTWDASEHLDSEEMIVAYMNAAIEDGDPALFTAALGDIARSRGMAGIAKRAGVSRESLYRALSRDGNPEFATIVKVMNAMGLRMSVASAQNDDRDARLSA
jgi:probable addiction module antidote protein